MKIFWYWDCFERYQINYTYRAGSDLGDVYQMRRKENRKLTEMYPGFQIMGSSGPLIEKFGGPLLSFGGPAIYSQQD